MDIILIILFIAIVGYSWRHTNFGRYTTLEDTWRIPTSTTKKVPQHQRKTKRQQALQKAKPFLKPYDTLMGEHCLANENCKVNLIIEKNDKKILCISKIVTEKNRRKIFTARVAKDFLDVYTYTPDYVIDNLWDLLCNNFSYTTAYENIYSALSAGMLEIQESFIKVKTNNTKTQQIYDSVSKTHIRTNNLLNINTATEAELTALPGVNVVTAKKAISYIEKHGQFNSLDEFITKMKIKDIFAEKIKEITCVKFDEDDISKKENTKKTENTPKTTETVKNTNTSNLDIFDDSGDTPYIPHSQNERIIDL